MVKHTKEQYKRMSFGYLLAASRTTDKAKALMLLQKAKRARDLSKTKRKSKRR